MEYLFSDWDNLKDKLSDGFIFIFLDYDGTLTPIARIPSKAVISQETKNLLRRISLDSRYALAVISGRTLEDIKNLVGLKGIIYVGNYGLEIEGPKIKFEALPSSRYKTILKQIKENLSQRLASINGAFVEDKGLSLSLHYRLATRSNIPKVKAAFQQAVISYLARNKVKVAGGKMILEVRPPVEWDKAKVVLWLLARQKFALKERSLLPIYIGDDEADECAFKALINKGITIFIGRPKSSFAQYYLKDSNEVKEFLRRTLTMQADKTYARSNKSQRTV